MSPAEAGEFSDPVLSMGSRAGCAGAPWDQILPALTEKSKKHTKDGHQEARKTILRAIVFAICAGDSKECPEDPRVKPSR